ncbi:hypothetical protein TWF225_006757 [Orbilia oligospora]|nr:hypothetical protein TWF225_006757 [Orbilia oligospora]KAF3233768.1 hypothetical protein TWF128_002880 [Orbilia oligospora]KAF3237475.1 hypothetical protein TWF217_002099 [Orbilia oligospora]KAF3279976.1 hypothetical protein TWF132_011991 [Orbilia oligospora]
MPPAPKAVTTGSSTFTPDLFFEAWSDERQKDPVPNHDLQSAIIQAFGLKPSDNYVYHAIASVTLQQVQNAILQGGSKGLHAWYRDEKGEPLEPPSESDIAAYTSIFNSATASNKAFSNFASNAKKQSLRAGVGSHLTSLRLPAPASISIPRSKSHINPYLDFWRWSCHNLEWCGPNESTANLKNSHHVLPIFMHHFGCVCPSYESIEIMKALSKARKCGIIDMGSGNGYWTYMLRRAGLSVAAVDNMQSLWRTMWVDDTIVEDGLKYLGQKNSGKNDILLLVYPIVSLDFTKQILAEYAGDIICIAGTQNSNGYTAFKDVTVNEYFEKEMKDFHKIVQVPLPSFAGKDEALYVFERKNLSQ